MKTFFLSCLLICAALFSLTQAAPKRDLKCETCQTMMYHLDKSLMTSPHSKYHGARDVLVMELLEKLCGWQTFSDYAKKSGLVLHEMYGECEKILANYDVEEDLEEALGKASTKESELREKFCRKTKICTELWSEDDLPHNRPDPAEANLKEGNAFLEENAKKDGVVTTASGLQYKVLKAGEGTVKPGPSDTVSCNYRGTLINGDEFDASKGAPIDFGVGGVIRGWTEALQLMTKGAKWELYIPSDLAYGLAGSGGKIGPNSALIFEIELVAVQPPTPSGLSIQEDNGNTDSQKIDL